MSNEPVLSLHFTKSDNDPEKSRVEAHDEVISLRPLSSDSDTPGPQIMNSTDSSDEEIDEKKLLRKIDYALIPWLGILYLLSFLDRSSIGNAKVCELNLVYGIILIYMQLYGMEADLRISDTQYLICLSVFFLPYALLEVSSLYNSFILCRETVTNNKKGTSEHMFEAPKAFDMVIEYNAPMGYHDGASFNIC